MDNYQENEQDEALIDFNDVIGLVPKEQQFNGADTYTLPDNSTPYERWVKDKSKENLFAATKALEPTIKSVVATLGGGNNPGIEARARVVAAKAIKSYDPNAGTSLPTWVSQQLRQLTRDIRKSNSVLSVPDKIQLEAMNLYKIEKELEDELDREPTTLELADKAHLSTKRIEKIRKHMRAVSGESGDEEGTEVSNISYKSDYTQDAMDYVYNDSDLLDRKILEMMGGYRGHKILDNKEIMAKLKISPVQLTRRKLRLGMRMKKIIQNLEDIQ